MMNRSKNITLVTGGAGFIGSHLVDKLQSQGKQVWVIDDLRTGSMENINPLLGAGCQFVQSSLCQCLKKKPAWLSQVNEIYHLAATVGVSNVLQDPLGTMDNNIHQTTVLLEHAVKLQAKVLIVSSSEVYGKTTQIPMSERQDLVIGPPTSPRWSYALSKALDEQLALAYHRQHKLPVVIARLFNIIGPRQVGAYGMVVPRFIERAVQNQDLPVYGNGEQTRCFCDVRDAVLAMNQLMETQACMGNVFNLGGQLPITIRQLADRIIALSGSSSRVKLLNYDQAYDWPCDDPVARVPNLTRIQNAIAYHQQYTLDQTLNQLITLQRNPLSQVTSDICK